MNPNLKLYLRCVYFSLFIIILSGGFLCVWVDKSSSKPVEFLMGALQ